MATRRRDDITLAPSPGQSVGTVMPGTRPGFTRPPGAPNNGAMGGRPRTGTGAATRSPMETLADDLPVADMPPGTPGAPAMPQVAPTPGATAPMTKPVAQSGQGGDNAVSLAPTPGMPNPAAPATAQAPGVQPAAAGVVQPMLTPMIPPPAQFATVPKDEDMATVPDGAEIQTPLGVGRKVDGRLADGFKLSDAGKVAYTHAKAQKLAKFGAHPLSHDPNAPLPPVEPGQTAYNPFAKGDPWVVD